MVRRNCSVESTYGATAGREPATSRIGPNFLRLVTPWLQVFGVSADALAARPTIVHASLRRGYRVGRSPTETTATPSLPGIHHQAF